MRVLRSIALTALMVTMVATTAFGSFLPAVPGKAETQGLRWRDRTIKIAVSNSVVEQNSNIKTDSDVLGAIRRSLATWEAVSDIRIEYEISDRTTVSPSGVSGDGISLITIAQTPENVLLFSKDPQAESAKTRVFFNRRNFITEADIVLNPFQQFSTDGTFGTFDLESTLTHEIGHLLGLRHSGVLGATMSGSLPKNGTFGLADLTARSLAESDIAAIRELYGADTAANGCCAVIVGKLNSGSPKPLKGLRVWAEESSTGRVTAIADVGADGQFKLGGLSAGTYTVFWQREDDLAPSPVSVLGTYKLAKDEARLINERISLTRSDMGVSYVGMNGQLTDSAISLAAGREYTVFVGGKNLDPRKIEIEFNSPYITLAPNSIAEQDFGSGISVVNFVVTVHENTPAGVYSIFVTGQDGSMRCLIGALNIQ